MQENTPQLLVYRASAGSGKTFTLAVQYIKQLITDPTAYRQILAVTFTNKATAEMKGRILSQLYGISIDDDGSVSYIDALKEETGLSAIQIREGAKRALEVIIHDYNHFRIETIDSFFQSVIRGLARELNLNINRTIELEVGRAIDDAVDALIKDLQPQSAELAYLLNYVEEKIEDNKRWNEVLKSLKGFSRYHLFKEEYLEHGKELREKLKDPQFIIRYKKALWEEKQKAERRMRSLGEHFLETIHAHHLSVEDFIYGSSGVAGYFLKLVAGNFLGEGIFGARCISAADDPEAWVTKKHERKAEILSLAETTLIPLLNETEAERVVQSKLCNSINLSLANLNDLGLLTKISDELQEQNHLHNRFLLADTNQLLHSLMKEGDASFIYEKIGTNINKMMIDEFQDTSLLQWENFRILLEECLSHTDGSLIVGDVKQSIYRWRGGDWRIFNSIEENAALRANVQSLSSNWRSERNIITFNNAFFQSIVELIAKDLEDERAQLIRKAYNDVQQVSPKQTAKGYVRVGVLEDSKALTTEEKDELLLSDLLTQINDLIERGVSPADMAILVRKSEELAQIVTYFKLHSEHKIISNEAFLLSASMGVNMIMDALRYLVDTDNKIALTCLAIPYQYLIMEKDMPDHEILSSNVLQYIPSALINQAEYLKTLPLYELTEWLYQHLQLEKLESEAAYYCAFFDAVSQFCLNNTPDIRQFIATWEDDLSKKAIPETAVDGIRILTIHKSKGLEYHTVLIPFCDWQEETHSTKSPTVWAEPIQDVEPFNQVNLLPIKYQKLMADSVFSASYREEQLQLRLDNLNLLYVAFTRACKNLYIWSTGKNIGKKVGEVMEHISEIALEKSTVQYEEEEAPCITLYEYGSPLSSGQYEKKETRNRLLFSPQSLPLSVHSISPRVEFRQSNRSAAFLKSTDEEKKDSHRMEYISNGQLLHNIFARIETTEDVEKTVTSLQMEGIIESNEQLTQLKHLLHHAFLLPQVKEWFSPKWKKYNECAIVYQDKEGIQTRRPDRVIMKDGKVVIIDFKFGQEKASYKRQVQEYMSLMTAMGYTSIEGYIWYVYANEIVNVQLQ